MGHLLKAKQLGVGEYREAETYQFSFFYWLILRYTKRSFYINLVLAAITAPVSIVCFPRSGVYTHEMILPRIKNLDWFGALLNAATYALFTTSCTYSGSEWPWSSGSVIVLWVMTGVTLRASTVDYFLDNQRRSSVSRLVPQKSILGSLIHCDRWWQYCP